MARQGSGIGCGRSELTAVWASPCADRVMPRASPDAHPDQENAVPWQLERTRSLVGWRSGCGALLSLGFGSVPVLLAPKSQSGSGSSPAQGASTSRGCGWPNL